VEQAKNSCLILYFQRHAFCPRMLYTRCSLVNSLISNGSIILGFTTPHCHTVLAHTVFGVNIIFLIHYFIKVVLLDFYTIYIVHLLIAIYHDASCSHCCCYFPFFESSSKQRRRYSRSCSVVASDEELFFISIQKLMKLLLSLLTVSILSLQKLVL
jgi:hypothetical protein